MHHGKGTVCSLVKSCQGLPHFVVSNHTSLTDGQEPISKAIESLLVSVLFYGRTSVLDGYTILVHIAYDLELPRLNRVE